MSSFGAIGLLGLLAAACTPSIEAQVFAVQSGYTAALEPAAVYVELPTCGKRDSPPPPGCSDLAAVERIQDAVQMAGPAIRGAQAEARREDGGNTSTMRAFLVTARAAIAALIAATPKKEPPS